MNADQEYALSELQRIIARAAKTPGKRDELLAALASTDWDEVAARIADAEHLAEEEYQEGLLRCARCDRSFPRRELVTIPGWLRSYYCARCAAAIGEANSYTCLVCGKSFLRRLPPPQEMAHCRASACQQEHALVVEQNTRARKIREPATLTLREWIATLRYFSSRCAYCQGAL